ASRGECRPVRDPEGAFVIRWGGSASAGRRRCSGSEQAAQRTRLGPSCAVEIVIFGGMQRRSGGCGSQQEPSAAPRALDGFRANKREGGSIKRIDGGCLAEGRENRKIRRARRQATAASPNQQEAPPKRGPSQGGNAPRGANPH